jgi:large subunit ribosomal protein L21
MKRWLLAALAAIGAVGALVTRRWRSTGTEGDAAAAPGGYSVPRPSVVEEAPDVAAADATVERAGPDDGDGDGGGGGEGLQAIRGIGPAMEARLAGVGVTSVAQLAAWSDAEVAAMAPRLQVGPERVEGWVAAARGVGAPG